MDPLKLNFQNTNFISYNTKIETKLKSVFAFYTCWSKLKSILFIKSANIAAKSGSMDSSPGNNGVLSNQWRDNMGKNLFVEI